MPALLDVKATATKRKRSNVEKRPSKRVARSESDDEDTQAEILLLENEVFESKKHYNNIAKLIKILKNTESEDSIVAAISLCRIFTRLMASGDLVRNKSTSEKEAVVIQWLRERYSEYKLALLVLLQQDGAGSTVLTLAMRTLKSEGTNLLNGQDYCFPAVFLADILRALLRANMDPAVRQEFSEKYVEENDDIRYYTYDALAKILDDNTEELPTAHVLAILKAVESVPESKDEIEDFYVPAPKKKSHTLYSLTAHKKAAQNAWLALMRMQMEREERKTILGLMSDCIAPWFMKPELLMDFLVDCYNSGGSTSLLALSGVFYLIQEKNLDYPAFYTKLYSLLDAIILHSKHRSRFFRLLDTFLASSHLPAVLVASFVKRLARLTLSAPPAAIVAVIPWIYNILKKHPSCTFMIHRSPRTTEEKEKLVQEGMDDPFLMDEEDPMDTNAIESSLWEIVMLQSHYHPNVATLAKIISEQFTKHAYNLEDFLDHSYGSMLDAELTKDVKKAPVVEYEIPKKIFMKQEAESGMEDNLLVKMWDF